MQTPLKPDLSAVDSFGATFITGVLMRTLWNSVCEAGRWMAFPRIATP